LTGRSHAEGRLTPEQDKTPLHAAPSRAFAAPLLSAAALTLAVAWFGSGFHVVPSAGGVFRGVSDLPGAGRLAAALGAGVVAVAVLAKLPAQVVRPLQWLALAALPLLPIALGRFEVLLAFQGRVLILVAFAAIGASVVRSAQRGSLRLPPARPGPLLAGGFAFYALLGQFLPGPAGPQGDEPHYLLLAESLRTDMDVDVADELSSRAYASFFAGSLDPHTSPASPAGRVLTIHAPGLPALILPAYAAFGYPGARLFMGLLAASTAVLASRLAFEVTRSNALALAAWGVLTFTPPFALYALAIYPEVPGALATAVFLLAARRTPGRALLAAAAACAAALPWLHPRFLPLAALGLLLTLARRVSPRARAVFVLLFLASVAALLLYMRALYGRAALSAAYGPGFASDVTLLNVPWGLAGLFFDRQFGVFSVAPLFLLSLPGAPALLRERMGDALRALLLGGASVLVGAAFSMWWGGACPPGRFAAAALPALIVLALPALRALPAAAGALAGLSAGVLAVAAEAPRALHNRADGESALLRLLAPALDLDPAWPSFVVGGARAPLLLASLAGALALAFLLRRRGAVAGLVAYAFVSSGLRERPLVDPALAGLELLSRWDGGNIVSFAHAFDPGALRLRLDLGDRPWRIAPESVHQSRRIDLPPGDYEAVIEARVVEALKTARVARLDFVAGDLLLERRYLREDQPLAPVGLLLPAGARRLAFTASGVQGHGVLDAVTLAPRGIVPRGRRADFAWPRFPAEDRYRVDSGGVRVTALDRAEPEAGAFVLGAGAERFLVEALRGASVEAVIERPVVRDTDAFTWSGRRLRLGAAQSVALSLPPEDGLKLGDVFVVPARVHAEGARVRFSGKGEPAASSVSKPPNR
jgi:hypothetical protein